MFSGFICPACQAKLSREAALVHFERPSPCPDKPPFIPAEVTERIWADNAAPHGPVGDATPSTGGCMRREVLRRCRDWWVSPLKLWKPSLGGLVHEALAAQAGVEWLCEVELPGAWLMQQEPAEFADRSPRQIEIEGRVLRCKEGFWQMELFPGVWRHGIADRLRTDLSLLRDIKTHMAPPGSYKRWTVSGKSYRRFEEYRKVYPPEVDAIRQVNTYGRMVETLYGVMPRLEILPMQLGVRDTTLAFGEPLEVAVMPHAELEAALRQIDAEMAILALPEPARTEAISGMKLAGRELYVGSDGLSMCDRECEVRADCDMLVREDDKF